MPSLNEFLGKPDREKHDWTGWEEMMGLYGCQKCPLDAETSYFNPSTREMKWICPDGHVSVVELD
jgi:hypothetical protein